MPDVIIEQERVLPVWKKTDVLVVGGGVSGIVAAVASARSGAGTVLIEQSGVLGGMAAVGLPFLVLRYFVWVVVGVQFFSFCMISCFDFDY